MYKRLIFLLVALISINVMAQKEAANWYFGSNAGLSFVTGEPVPLLDGELDTFEGCASISTSTGDLLFYTNGENVWNKNHILMANGTGLLGNRSATQSALIVPKPGNNTLYYIFTSDVASAYEIDLNGNIGDGNGINYSIVDMSLNSGLGDVTVKNTTILNQGSENITAVQTVSGSDFWIITQARDKFYSFLLSSSGVNTPPVVSTIGPDISEYDNFRGAIKASPNGEKIAIAHAFFVPSSGGKLLLYDFNNTTGVVSNEISLADDLVFYGVEFSGNSSKLYASGKINTTGNAGDVQNVNILQFDLDAPNIPDSRYGVADIPTSLSVLSGTLQLGIDKKIYHAIQKNSLSVINYPNIYGAGSDLRVYSVPLGGRNSTFGLPPFVQSFFESIVNIQNLCFQEATQFTLDTNDAITSIQWDFGDTGSSNTSTLLNPTHTYSNTGTFTVTINVDFVNLPNRTFIEYVVITDVPTINPNITLVECDLDSMDDGITEFTLADAIPLLVTDPSGIQATFFEDRNDAIANVNQIITSTYRNLYNNQVIYARVFQNPTCYALAEITLNVGPLPAIETITLQLCDQNPDPDSVLINLLDIENILLETYPNLIITFYNTEEDALRANNVLIDVYEGGPNEEHDLYFRIENANACASIGHILIDAEDAPVIEDKTFYICPGEVSVDLYISGDYLYYDWSTGETTESITVTQPGTYTVNLSNVDGCDGTANIIVEIVEPIQMVEVVVSDFSNNNKIEIFTDNASGYKYSITGGASFQSEPVFSHVKIGLYEVEVWKGTCLLYQELVVVGGPPNFFTPNNDNIHDTWEVVGIKEYNNAQVYIFDRFGKLLKQLNPQKGGWDGTYNGNPLPASDYWYRIELEDGRMLNGNFTLKR